jgi:erythromycin esterase
MQIFGSEPEKWTDDELRWLAPYAEAKVLGLGEAVHTSDGFYTAKVRIIKYLIENHNYRAISWESPWGKALSATKFVENNDGTVEDALNGLFRVWRSKSVAGLLLWLRDWNISHPNDPVRFFGNDTQQPDWDLECILSSVCINQTDKNHLKDLFMRMFGGGIFLERFGATAEYKKLMTSGFDENQDLTSEIVELLETFPLNKDTLEYVARISLVAYVRDVSKSAAGKSFNDGVLQNEAFAVRDKCMSDITLYFARNDKTILWAHNEHIQRSREVNSQGLFFQGQFLHKVLGDNYKAIALTAPTIEIHWPWVAGMVMAQPSENSLEIAIAAKYPELRLFITSKIAENLPGEEYCAGYHQFSEEADISFCFDGLIVLPHSRAIEYAVDVTSN